MKKLYFLAIACFALINAKAEVPEAVYFQDFESGLSADMAIVGSGELTDADDSNFGKVYHNNPDEDATARTNYLTLPSDIFSDMNSAIGEDSSMTIAFWVNASQCFGDSITAGGKNQPSYFYAPLFSAYGDAPVDAVNTYPMMICQTRGPIQINNSGWCDFGTDYEDNGFPIGTNDSNSVDWLSDNEWHYFSVTMSTTTAKVYYDGTLTYSWTIDGVSDGQVSRGMFTNGADLDYICLGGNQAWDWGDSDQGFLMDDFAVYASELSADQINEIITAKTEDSGSTAIATTSESNGTIVSTVFYGINGVNMGDDLTDLNPGIYIQCNTYTDGSVKSVKVSKTTPAGF